VYEFQVPLVLLGAGPGDTLGLFGGSQPVPGVTDYGAYAYSTWPRFVTFPISLGEYGDLNLALPPGPVGVSMSPSSASQLGSAGERVNYTLRVRNTGTAGADTFDMNALWVWTVLLWDATGVNPLSDTDGDTVPDTGSLASGASVNVVVSVDIPPSTNGCDAATITATSSVDTAFWDTSTLTTCTGPASFAPPHADFGIDTDGDSRFNYLEVDANVGVTTASYYYVVGELYSGDGSVSIDYATWSFYGVSGTYVVPLTFDSFAIYGSGLDGPYQVELDLFDNVGRLIDTDVHMSAAYQFTDFDPPPARFNAPHTDSGLDTDVPPNGLYDRFVLRANLQVDNSGYYYVGTEVYDSQGSYISYQSSNSWLDAGSPILQFEYPGIAFYRASADGPYTIRMWLFDYSGNFLDNDTHVTGPYARSDFDPPPISFAPPHADRGEDADAPPDGLYDFLVVSVSVDVWEDGDFRIAGSLAGPGGFPFIDENESIVTLSPGPATVDLRFSGPAIRRAAVSGNFEVGLYAQKMGDFNATEYDRHTTGYYDFSAFQSPPALFSLPHGDRAVDVSVPPDGYYDDLVIDAFVDVTRAGRFTVEAYVVDYYGRFLTQARGAADLESGRGSIPVRIDGHLIWQQYPYMPLYVYMTLYDANDNVLDWSTHSTDYYDAGVFQPPDVDTPSSAATVAGGYFRSATPVRVDYAGADPSPSDGISSVALYYRYSPNNATWFPWTLYESQGGTVSHAMASGTFQFEPEAGDGYYEFFTVATDYVGNEESWAAAADARIAAFVPVRLELVPASAAATAGETVGVRVRALTDAGAAVTLESSTSVTLLTTSGAGVFRDSAGNVVTQVSIPAGAGEVLVNYADTRAGTATLLTSASGLDSGSASISINPGAPVELSLSPPSAGVIVGGSVTFAATVWDAYGNAIPSAPIAWSVQGNVGQISSGGIFAARTKVGTGAVSVESGGLTMSASIVLSPGPLDRMETLATAYGLTPGGTATVHALALDQYGNVIPDAAVAWTVQGPGALSATTGDFVTVTATGSGTIRVTATAGSLSTTTELAARAPEGAAPVGAVGVGGVAGGLAVGFGIGWFLSRKRNKPAPEETSSPPPMKEPEAPK
jgi:hypothetical protein